MAKRWEEKEEKEEEEEEKVVGRNMDLFPLLSLLHTYVAGAAGLTYLRQDTALKKASSKFEEPSKKYLKMCFFVFGKFLLSLSSIRSSSLFSSVEEGGRKRCLFFLLSLPPICGGGGGGGEKEKGNLPKQCHPKPTTPSQKECPSYSLGFPRRKK